MCGALGLQGDGPDASKLLVRLRIWGGGGGGGGGGLV